jgi:hypothetical protein
VNAFATSIVTAWLRDSRSSPRQISSRRDSFISLRPNVPISETRTVWELDVLS